MKNKIKKLIKEREIKPRPEIGQYFTIDRRVTRDLIHFAEINKNDRVVEVGAGTGILL